MVDGEWLAIPNVGIPRHDLCREYHDMPLGGHFGYEQTGLTLKWGYYWPRMSRMVAAYFRGYDVYHRIKPPNQKPFGELEQLQIPEEQ